MNERVIDRSKYREIYDGKKILEAVYRIQQAQSKKECSKEDCLLDSPILPMQDYARVYYEDEDEVEFFHYACFRDEFIR